MSASLTLGNRRRGNIPRRPFRVANNENSRETVQLSPQRAPDPPRPGMVRARPAKVQVFQSLNRRAIRSVARDHFYFGKGRFRMGASQPYGSQLPYRERANINSPGPQAYGSRFAMEPTFSAHEDHIRLLAGMI